MDELRLLKIEVRGWAGIDEVVILDPPDWLIEFWSLENGEGKTSLLEAIRLALGGGTLKPGAIRTGESGGEVAIDMGSCALHCTVQAERGRTLSLKVRNAEGKLVPWPKKPQGFLDGLVGKMLDPGGFQDLDDEKQRLLVQELADPLWLTRRAELERAVGNAEVESTEAGREVRRIGDVPAVPPAEAVDVAALASEIERVESENRRSAEAHAAWRRKAEEEYADYERREAAVLATWKQEQEGRVQRREVAAQGVALLAASVARLKEQLAAAEAELFQAKQRASLLPSPETMTPVRAPAPVLEPAPVVTTLDTAPLRQQMAEANERNAGAALYRRYLEQHAEKESALAAHTVAKEAVVAARAALAAHDRTAQLPEGLAISGSGLTYADRPLLRMSTGEGCRLAFSIAARRGQRILVLDNAEALGPKTIRTIAELASEFKIWVVMATRGQPHTPGAYELRNGRLAIATGESV